MSDNIVARGRREGKTFDLKKIIKIVAIIAAAIMVIGIISSMSKAGKTIESHTHSRYCYKYSYRNDFNKDNKNNDLKDYKMDCDYAGSAFGLGLSNYFEGGVILPILVLAGGVAYAFTMRKRSRGYELAVTKESINVEYTDGKQIVIPLCSVFSLEKVGENGLHIVTSESAYTLQEMEGVNEVYAAVTELLPNISIKGPANNEQVLAKGYPPAVKPLLLILLILVGLTALITVLATEEAVFLALFIVPVAILLALYLLAKTPYFVVTDKRVFYVSDFGRKLSLPMNQITVTVTHWWFRQLHIAAPAGRIHLFWVRNTAELYDIINAVLNEKQ